MAAGNRGSDHLEPSTLLAAALLVLFGMPCLLVWGALAITAARHGDPMPGNPFGVGIELARGRRPWPGTTATLALAGELVLLGAAAAAALMVRRRWARSRTRVDAAAPHMGRRADLAALAPAGAAESAARLRPGIGRDVRGHGPLIGLSVAGRVPLRASWEDTHIAIWGPRTGKTSSMVIPDVLDAPGAVLTTSNRRDVVDATRDPRAAHGPVWVFDPQQVAGEPPTWWWDPLTGVTSVTAAKRLASHFAAASRPPDAKRDAFFDPAGEDLLAYLLLAAAASKSEILAVYGWLSDPVDRTPQRILETHGHTLPARAVAGVIGAPEKLRGSVFATAQQMAACLVEPAVTRWVTPAGPSRPRFDPDAFVASTATLYPLSREGEGTAAPLVTALCAAVFEAAERLATRSPGGRLPVPLVAPLDEAANVCRIRALPDLYSHYGGRGIILKTILQSWSQGVEVWGEKGMAKLWSAANIKTFGGGVSETGFLKTLADLIGDHDITTTSTSWTKGTRTTSRSTRRDKVLGVAQLGAMPRGRAVLIASGMVPTLIEPQPWWTGPHADAVDASITAHDPAHAVINP